VIESFATPIVRLPQRIVVVVVVGGHLYTVGDAGAASVRP